MTTFYAKMYLIGSILLLIFCAAWNDARTELLKVASLAIIYVEGSRFLEGLVIHGQFCDLSHRKLFKNLQKLAKENRGGIDDFLFDVAKGLIFVANSASGSQKKWY